MAKYIDLEALKQFPIRKDHYDKENGNEDFIFGIEAVLEYADSLHAADVAPVRKELRKAVKVLDKNYEYAINNSYVRDPIAWALYQTWKHFDER